MSNELIELGVAAVVIILVLLVLRRASNRSRAQAPQSVRERLGVEE